jgi:hypothetical protein
VQRCAAGSGIAGRRHPVVRARGAVELAEFDPPPALVVPVAVLNELNTYYNWRAFVGVDGGNPTPPQPDPPMASIGRAI